MGVAGGLAGHHPQAEALGGVIGGRFQPPVVEHEDLALGALDEQLAVVGAGQRLAEDVGGALGIDAGGFEDRGGGDVSVHGRLILEGGRAVAT